VALASPRVASTLDDALEKIRSLMSEAAAQGAEIVCFPEAYVPGLRGQDFEVFPFDRAAEERSLRTVSQWAREHRIATILGMERSVDAGAGAGRQIVSVVMDATAARPVAIVPLPAMPSFSAMRIPRDGMGWKAPVGRALVTCALRGSAAGAAG